MALFKSEGLIFCQDLFKMVNRDCGLPYFGIDVNFKSRINDHWLHRGKNVKRFPFIVRIRAILNAF